jgi:hypothetical protein
MTKESIFDDEVDNATDIPQEERILDTSFYDYSIEFIYNQIQRNKIELQVPFQRKYIWKEDRSSLLIESIIMNVPIPPLYFAEEIDGKWLVIDGLQRLSAIKKFYENEYGLKKLEIIRELEGLKYKDLPPKSKGLLDDGLLRVNVIKKNSHPDIKYDIFMRLNKGAVNLTDQELRNCLYRGKLNDLAKELVNYQNYLDILGQKTPHPRFNDAEYIIRFLAFYNNLIEENGKYRIKNYKGSLKYLINNFMEDNRNPDDDVLNGYSDLFKTSIDKIIKLFDKKNALRDPRSKSKKVNKALSDAVLLALTKISKEEINKDAKNISKKFEEIINSDEFNNSLRKKAADKSNVEARINLLMSATKKWQKN